MTEASENVPLRKADHRLLCDLVDFERLAAAQRQQGDEGSHRDRFAHCLSLEFAPRSVRPTLPQPSGFDNAVSVQTVMARREPKQSREPETPDDLLDRRVAIARRKTGMFSTLYISPR
jgi:hypothetical protein